MIAARLHRRARRGERGAVLVEVVIMLPVLLVIALGVFDVGLGWKASMTLSSSTRAGARVATNLGISSSADKSALASIAASMGSIPASQIDTIVIYKATSATGTVPSNCLSASVKTAGGSAADLCNVYSATDMNNAATSSAYTGVCGSSRDRFYCPTTRGNSQASSNGPDYVGVYIRINLATKTKLFGSTMTLDETSVMRIEPNAGNP